MGSASTITPTLSRWRWALPLLIMLAIAGGMIWLRSSGIGGHADCAWQAPVLAWIDENGNGRWDTGEPPLEGAQFHVNDTRNGYSDVGYKAVSDWRGRTTAYVWLPGCPSARFEVAALPPPGYQVVGETLIQIKGTGYGSNASIRFGFSRIPGFPTPTPYRAGLICTVATQPVNDLAKAPDGALWLVSNKGAARYQPATGSWQPFSTKPEIRASFDRIQIGARETIWISQRDRAAARWQQGSWAYYTGENNLIASSEPSIGATPDGLIWFAPESPPNSLIAFNPATQQWRALQSDKDYGAGSVRIFTDGEVWRAAFGYASSYALPPALPNGWTAYERHVFSPAEIEPLPLGSGRLKAAEIDRTGQIWLASSFGVLHLNPATGAVQLHDAASSNQVLAEQLEDLALAPDGSVWLASGRAHALAFLLPAGAARWRQFDPRDGIPDQPTIDRVEVDASGAAWFAFTGEATLARCMRTLE